jgi:Spy/CpxP family protein refolding chaperone
MGFASFAQDVEPFINAGTGNMDRYVAEKKDIGLSNDQVVMLQSIRTSLMQKNADLIKQRTAMINEIKTLMSAEDVAYDIVGSKLSELDKVRSQIMLNRLAAAKEADSVLTADQKGKFKKLRAERMEKAKALTKERMEKIKSMKKGPAR